MKCDPLCSHVHVFLFKKVVYRQIWLKLPKSKESRKKFSWLNFQTLVVLFAKIRYYVIITFKMLLIEFNFEYARLAKKI